MTNKPFSHGVANGEARYWLEAYLEVPETKVVQADVSKQERPTPRTPKKRHGREWRDEPIEVGDEAMDLVVDGV